MADKAGLKQSAFILINGFVVKILTKQARCYI
jgi:hypothetical protein